MPSLIKTYLQSLNCLSSSKAESALIIFFAISLACLQFSEPYILGMIINSLILDKSSQTIQYTVLLLVAWALVSASIIFINTKLNVKSDLLAHRHRLLAITEYFSATIDIDTKTKENLHSGRLTKIMLQGVDNLYAFWVSFFRGHVEVFITLLVLMPLTLFLNFNLGLLLIFTTIIFVFIIVNTVKKTENLQNNVEELHTKMVEKISDSLSHAEIIKAYDRVPSEVANLKSETANILAAQTPVLSLWAIANVLNRSAATIFMTLILIYGVWLNYLGEANIGEIVSFVSFSALIAARLDQLSSFVSQLLFQSPSIGQFFDVIKISKKEKVDSKTNARLSGNIVFKDVSAGYGQNLNAVKDLNFTIESGKRTAIVGHTGAGKSTVLSLIYGALRPRSGTISFGPDNYDLISSADLRNQFSIVFQETFLLNRSIEENLKIGNPLATSEELHEALNLAHADFVFSLKDGIQTIVGEHGSILSGGERQRICLARAFLKNAPVVILDEATNSLDFKTENFIDQAIAIFSKNSTLIIATHKITQLKLADLILVFDNGELVEQGSYQELSKDKNGFFSKLFLIN